MARASQKLGNLHTENWSMQALEKSLPNFYFFFLVTLTLFHFFLDTWGTSVIRVHLFFPSFSFAGDFKAVVETAARWSLGLLCASVAITTIRDM